MEWRTLYGEGEGLCGCQMREPSREVSEAFSALFSCLLNGDNVHNIIGSNISDCLYVGA